MVQDVHNEIDEHLSAGNSFDSLFDWDEMGDRDTHWRMCYHRAGRDKKNQAWRLRDERTGRLWLVDGYEGPVNISWLDGGSHIFHDGQVAVDEEGIAHFSE